MLACDWWETWVSSNHYPGTVIVTVFKVGIVHILLWLSLHCLVQGCRKVNSLNWVDPFKNCACLIWLPAKSDWHPKVFAIQKWHSDKNSWQPKVAAKPKMAASQNWLPAKKCCQPKVAGSKKCLSAKSDCQPKVTASQKWVPTQIGCQLISK